MLSIEPWFKCSGTTHVGGSHTALLQASAAPSCLQLLKPLLGSQPPGVNPTASTTPHPPPSSAAGPLPAHTSPALDLPIAFFLPARTSTSRSLSLLPLKLDQSVSLPLLPPPSHLPHPTPPPPVLPALSQAFPLLPSWFLLPLF